MSKTAVEAPRGTIFKLEPEKLTLVTDRNNPLFDERVLMQPSEAMVRNIMWQGVIETVGITKDLEVIYGRQRVKAAIIANERLREQGKELIRVKCEVVRGEGKDLFSMCVSENEHREDDSPIAKAMKANRMLQLGASNDEVCVAFGVTKQAVRNWLAVLDLSSVIKKAIDDGEITATAALALGKLPKEEQQAKLEEMKTQGGRVTTERARRAASSDSTDSRPRMRSRKEIEAKLKDELPDGWVAALEWVLGEDD
jgi:ParB family transcriptional regulator, chromosome partitioning protein